jgi:hypothetical protein
MKSKLTRECPNKLTCIIDFKMSVHSEYNILVGLINELFFRTKYDLKLTVEVVRSLKKRTKQHLENMAMIMTDSKYNQSIQRIPVTDDELNAEDELDSALKKVKRMLAMASNDLSETWYLNTLISEVMTHLDNFETLNYQNRCDDNSFDTPIIDWKEAMRRERVA